MDVEATCMPLPIAQARRLKPNDSDRRRRIYCAHAECTAEHGNRCGRSCAPSRAPNPLCLSPARRSSTPSARGDAASRNEPLAVSRETVSAPQLAASDRLSRRIISPPLSEAVTTSPEASRIRSARVVCCNYRPSSDAVPSSRLSLVDLEVRKLVARGLLAPTFGDHAHRLAALGMLALERSHFHAVNE